MFVHEKGEKMNISLAEEVEMFVEEKCKILNSQEIASQEKLRRLINKAYELELYASLNQLEQYRDHYYPKEEK